MHEIRLPLRPRLPFAWRLSLEDLEGFRASAVDRVVAWRPGGEGGTLSYAAALPAGFSCAAAWVEVSGAADGASLACIVRTGVPLSAEEAAWLERAVVGHLALEDDVAGLLEAAVGDDAFLPLVERLRGLHPVRFTSAFEAACWALVTQRTPNVFAFGSMRRLVEAAGAVVRVDGVLGVEGVAAVEAVERRAFPVPEAVLAAGSGALLAATNNVRKSERLRALAEAFVGLDEGFLREAPYGAARAWLKGIHGVGDWTAEFVLLRGAGRFEEVPWSDTALAETVGRVYADGLPVARSSVRELARPYGPLAGLWFAYLKAYGRCRGAS